jgi:hypothetical protein
MSVGAAKKPFLLEVKMYNGGLAFLTKWANKSVSGGMTLRDFYAGQAMANLAYEPTLDYKDAVLKGIAKLAYEYADAMIAERNKVGEK